MAIRGYNFFKGRKFYLWISGDKERGGRGVKRLARMPVPIAMTKHPEGNVSE